jgi:radical SAM family uncharacterized protein
MTKTPSVSTEYIQSRLERILPTVTKPGRYTGGEFNQVVKDWDAVQTRVALAFPDIYDLGLPNLGLAIFYEALNDRPDVLAERTYLPWLDMEAALRQAELPLYSLETHHALADFDILALTLPYETLYTNTLNLLDLARIPLLSRERTPAHPLVIAGGHACYNPEPMADFIDAFAIGDGEEVFHDIIAAQQAWMQDGGIDRIALLRSLAQIPGVYVPALYAPRHHPDGTLAGVEPIDPAAPRQVTKRVVGQLPPAPTRFIVPSIDVVHNRVSVEIMRGCTRGCRFCHAGMVNRPVRERSVAEVIQAIQSAIRQTGFEEVALLSLSSSDYSRIVELVEQVSQKVTGPHLTVSLPSLRIESFSVALMEQLRGGRQGSFTLAPEAATERMRNTINKPIQDAQLLETAAELYSRGWPTLKLYFMIGHPSETLEDVQAIADLCLEVMAVGRKAIGRRASLHIGVSTFVPKPHTPFQWVACDDPAMIEAKIQLLRRALRSPGLKLNWTDPRETLLEAWLSRGDRRLGQVIWQAWRHGAKFDAWQDQFNFEAWQTAFAECSLDPADYTHRVRAEDEVFAWDQISPGVSKAYLLSEYHASLAGQLTGDCREECFACGILPQFAALRRQLPRAAWFCPGGDPAKT